MVFAKHYALNVSEKNKDKALTKIFILFDRRLKRKINENKQKLFVLFKF